MIWLLITVLALVVVAFIFLFHLFKASQPYKEHLKDRE